jgi:uncharacterized protein
MKIHLAQIPADGLRLQGEVPAAVLEVVEPGTEVPAPINYDVVASQMGSALLVQGRVWTRATLRCVRCLKNFKQDVETREFVVHRPLTGEELVDLTAEVREDILLQLPAHPVCRPECKGLCPSCGQDLNKSVCQCERAVGNPAWTALEEAWRTSKKPKKP